MIAHKNSVEIKPLPSTLRHTLRSVQPWVIWGCASLFYLFQFVLRVSPSVMVSDLMVTFHVDAATVGSLGAAAYFAYSMAQVPVGLMLDQWGARRTILLMLFLCVLGCWGFSYAEDVWVAKLSRFFIGLGSAGGFLGCAKLTHVWFPPRKTGLVLGLTVAIGTLGAICGGQPLAHLIQSVGWRTSMQYMVFAGAALGCLMMLLIKEPSQPSSTPTHHTHSSYRAFMQDLWQRLTVVLLCPISWAAAGASIGNYLILSLVADMWGVTYLQQVYGYSRDKAAALSSVIYMGLLVGSLLLPWLSNVLESRKKPFGYAFILALSGWVWLFFWPETLSSQGIRVLFFMMGIMSGTQIIPFSIVADIVPKSHVAMATAFVNMAAMLAGAVLQYIAGLVLDHFWQGDFVSHGLRVYPAEAFKWALGGCGIFIIISFGLLLTLKETYPRSVKKSS